jgi:hypothetical protein
VLLPRPHFGLVVAALVVTTSTCTRETGEPTAACQAVLDCYFADGQLDAVPGFDGLFPSDSDIVLDTYGSGGTCWIGGDPDVAQSCDDRCKGLLWQDCARSYRRVCEDDVAVVCLVDEDCVAAGAVGPCIAAAREGPADEFEVPFCSATGAAAGAPDACNEEFALRCRFEDFAILQGQGRQPDEPLFSACPEDTRCNAIPPPFVDPDTAPDATNAIGCCENLERGLLVNDRESCNE